MVRNVRVGVLVPSTNQVVEPDFARLMPQGMTFHTERLWNGDVTPEGGGDGTYLLRMNDDLERGVRYLASANLDVIAYCCTSGTYHAGTLEYDGELANRIHGESGLPAITAMSASLEALRHVGARKISIAGPYGNFLLRERLTGMLEGQGLKWHPPTGRPQCSNGRRTQQLETRSRTTLPTLYAKLSTRMRIRSICLARLGEPWRWSRRWRTGWDARLSLSTRQPFGPYCESWESTVA